MKTFLYLKTSVIVILYWLIFPIFKRDEILISAQYTPAKSQHMLMNERAGLNGPCETSSNCTSVVLNSTCKNSTCACQQKFPVYISEAQTCVKSVLLEEDCNHELQCKFYDQNAECQQLSRDVRMCMCHHEYIMRDIEGLDPPKVCFPGPSMLSDGLPTILGFIFSISIMSAMLCLVLKIFSRARYVRARRYANANIPPPLTVSETYAAYALAANSNDQTTGAKRTSFDMPGSSANSRRTSYSSLHPRSDMKRLSSVNSLSYKPGSRRPSASSIRSYRSQSGTDRKLSGINRSISGSDRRITGMNRAQSGSKDHYILYVIRRTPSQKMGSLGSNSTTSTTCETPVSVNPETILGMYRAAQEDSIKDPYGQGYSSPSGVFIPYGAIGGGMNQSHTTSTFRTISSEEIFEEDEDDLGEEFEENTIIENLGKKIGDSGDKKFDNAKNECEKSDRNKINKSDRENSDIIEFDTELNTDTKDSKILDIKNSEREKINTDKNSNEPSKNIEISNSKSICSSLISSNNVAEKNALDNEFNEIFNNKSKNESKNNFENLKIVNNNNKPKNIVPNDKNAIKNSKNNGIMKTDNKILIKSTKDKIKKSRGHLDLSGINLEINDDTEDRERLLKKNKELI